MPRAEPESRATPVRVRSIVGRFLEHSRIFFFAAGNAEPLEGRFFIGSADWMHRNLSSRVEVVTPVTASNARQRLWEVLDVCLRDRRHAWQMDSDARYTQLQPESSAPGPEGCGTHQMLIDLTSRRLLTTV